jgi:hypothetical protein
MSDFDPQPGTLDAFHKGMEEMQIAACEEDGRDYHEALAQEAADALAAKKAGWDDEAQVEFHRRARAGLKPYATTMCKLTFRDSEDFKRYHIRSERGWATPNFLGGMWPYIGLVFEQTMITKVPMSKLKFFEEG